MYQQVFQTLAILIGIVIAMLFILVYYSILEVQKRKVLEERIDDLDRKLVGFFIEQNRAAQAINELEEKIKN